MEQSKINYYAIAIFQCLGVCFLKLLLLIIKILGRIVPFVYNNPLIRRLQRIPFFPPKDCKLIQQLNEANEESSSEEEDKDIEDDTPAYYTDMLDGTYVNIYDETMTPITKEEMLKRSKPKSRK